MVNSKCLCTQSHIPETEPGRTRKKSRHIHPLWETLPYASQGKCKWGGKFSKDVSDLQSADNKNLCSFQRQVEHLGQPEKKSKQISKD